MDITGRNVLIDVNLILKKAQVGDKMKVADLGCGATGHYVFASSKLVGKNGIVYAVDILKTILETIERRAKQENIINVKTIWSDLEMFGATQIESSSLDVALLINTLFLSHKRVEIIRESIRMLKKESRLVIVEWKNIAAPLGPPIETRVKKELLLAGARKLGLMPEEEFDAGEYHYGLTFIKL